MMSICIGTLKKKLNIPMNNGKDFPYCVCGAKSEGKIVNKKPIIATEEEQIENSNHIKRIHHSH